MGSIRKLTVLIGVIFMLVGCGENEETIFDDGFDIDATIETITETIAEKEHDILLIDNEDLRITLLNSKHERNEDYEIRDEITLYLNVENKKNRTFNLLFRNLSLDGSAEELKIGMADSEIAPKEEKELALYIFNDVLEEDKTLAFNEHISGDLWYSDHERSRIDERFSEYIIEQ